MSHATLYYIHDPMCSWCWGFRTVWLSLMDKLKQDNISIQAVLGGLAVDSDQAMPIALQRTLQATWKRIQLEIPATKFNDNFWHLCQPRRSTYPACRAVIAAKNQGEDYEYAMITAIQQAYYLQAKNPSDYNTLYECAESIGVNVKTFTQDVHSNDVQKKLENDIAQYHTFSSQVGVFGFPSLVLEVNHGDHSKIANPVSRKLMSVAVDYHSADTMYQTICQALHLQKRE